MNFYASYALDYSSVRYAFRGDFQQQSCVICKFVRAIIQNIKIIVNCVLTFIFNLYIINYTFFILERV